MLETFVPLYLTNRCDAICTVCSMRKGNQALRRVALDLGRAANQLRIIKEIEGISAVCFLTGEYRQGTERRATMKAVAELAETAFARGFERVYINIGALYDDEVRLFQAAFAGMSELVLSLFQETYNRETYWRIFGREKRSNPKGDFDLRLSTPMRWLEAGFRSVDVGILVGLSPLDEELEELVEHAGKLRARGASVSISLPRIRGVDSVPCPVADTAYSAAIRSVAAACPWAKIILTTRESVPFIREMLPHIGTVSPGTSDVMPYRASGPLPNREETSQFVVAPTRPRPSSVLEALGLPAGSIRYYSPRSREESRLWT